MIRRLPTQIFVPGQQNFRYVTRDGSAFMQLEEAVDYENHLNLEEGKPTVVYEQIWTIQEAINKAVAENRVVRFIWHKTNEELKKGIDDLKNCSIMQAEKGSMDTAVIPPSITDFIFAEVK